MTREEQITFIDKWLETPLLSNQAEEVLITAKQALKELGIPYQYDRRIKNEK